MQALLAWWKTTRLARALARYGQVNGALLCGGIAYSAIFSVFAGLTIGFTVFMRSSARTSSCSTRSSSR